MNNTLEHLVAALKEITAHGRPFSNIQINYGVKGDKYSVKVAFSGYSYLGSGQTVEEAIAAALHDATG